MSFYLIISIFFLLRCLPLSLSPCQAHRYTNNNKFILPLRWYFCALGKSERENYTSAQVIRPRVVIELSYWVVKAAVFEWKSFSCTEYPHKSSTSFLIRHTGAREYHFSDKCERVLTKRNSFSAYTRWAALLENLHGRENEIYDGKTFNQFNLFAHSVW